MIIRQAKRPSIIAIEKKERKGIIIDIAVPADDVRVGEKKREKISGPEGRDWKIEETQKGRSCICSDRSPWKCHQRI